MGKKEIKNINYPELSQFKLFGNYVVNNNPSEWVYDINIYDNDKLIYVIGFTPKQLEGAVFNQLRYEEMSKYELNLDKFKIISKDYVNKKIIYENDFIINNKYLCKFFNNMIKKNQYKLYSFETMGYNLYKSPDSWYNWFTYVIPILSNDTHNEYHKLEIKYNGFKEPFHKFSTCVNGYYAEASYTNTFISQ